MILYHIDSTKIKQQQQQLIAVKKDEIPFIHTGIPSCKYSIRIQV